MRVLLLCALASLVPHCRACIADPDPGGCPGDFNIVSAIDADSAALALIKAHSLIQSTERKQLLYFHFLTMSADVLEQSKAVFRMLFPETRVRFKLFERPKVFSKFSNKNYEKDVIFARLLVPILFEDLDTFLYLDNDIVANVDVEEVYSFPMFDRMSNSYVPTAFTVEHAAHHGLWIRSHFNTQHSLYKASAASHRNPLRYINSGVWLCNATMWRHMHLSEKALNIIERSFTEYIYNRNVTSDQEIFYLLLRKEDIAELPSRFNMGTHSYSSFGDLSRMRTGIIHFAGIDKSALCARPFRHKYLLRSGALPYFLSVVESLLALYKNKLPLNELPAIFKACSQSVTTVRSALLKKEIEPIGQYNPGRGNFSLLFA